MSAPWLFSTGSKMGMNEKNPQTSSSDGLIICPLKGLSSITYGACAKFWDEKKCADLNCTHHVMARNIIAPKKEKNGKRNRKRRPRKPDSGANEE